MSRWFRTYGFAEIDEDLLSGAYPGDQADIGMLAMMGVDRVLNLVEDDEYGPGEREAVQAALREKGILEERCSVTDYGNLPAEALEAAVGKVARWLQEGHRVYVHCRAGWQRSAAVAAGVVAERHGLPIEDALEHVRHRKPSADPLPHQREDLERWWHGRSPQGGGTHA